MAVFLEIIDRILDDADTPRAVAGVAMTLGEFDPVHPDDLANLKELIYWLFVYDRNDDALALTAFTKDEPLDQADTSTQLIHLLTMRARLLRAQDNTEAAVALDKIRTHYAEKKLRRLLKGSTLNDMKIKAYVEEGNTEQANRWRFRDLAWLCFIRELGGSEELPPAEAERRILEVKSSLNQSYTER